MRLYNRYFERAYRVAAPLHEANHKSDAVQRYLSTFYNAPCL